MVGGSAGEPNLIMLPDINNFIEWFPLELFHFQKCYRGDLNILLVFLTSPNNSSVMQAQVHLDLILVWITKTQNLLAQVLT